MTGILEHVPCNLCGEDKTRLLAVKFGLSLVVCRRCGLIYASPRLSAEAIQERYESPDFFDEYLRIFQADRRSFNPRIFRSHWAAVLDALGAASPPGRLLDVGCAAGFFIKAAAERGWQAQGVEISRVASGYARDIVGVPVLTGTMESAGYPSGSFDAVTMLDFLEHARDPSAALEEAFRVLKDGGMLLLNTPDVQSLSRRILGVDWAVLSPGEHLFVFSEKSLRSLLQKAGFTSVSIRNRLAFNPDYTHARGELRHRLWKTLYAVLEKTALAGRVDHYETFVMTGIGKPPSPAVSRALSSSKRFKRSAQGVYARARRLVRGDMLYATAWKPKARI